MKNITIITSLLALVVIIGSINAASVGLQGTLIYTNTLAPNIIYQNTNAINLNVYGVIEGNYVAWIGNEPTFTTANFIRVANVLVASGSVISAGSDISSFDLLIPPFWYFSVNNFGGNQNSFVFEYIGNVNAITLNGNVIGNNAIFSGNVASANYAGNVVGINTLPLSAGIGTKVINGNEIDLLPLTPGTGIQIISTNTVTALASYNSAYLTSVTTQNGIWNTISGQIVTIGVNSASPISNTLNQLGCPTCWTGTNYNGIYAGYPINFLPYNNLHAGSGITISGNTITATGYNAVYDNILTSYYPYNNIKAGAGIQITNGNQIDNLNISLTSLIVNLPLVFNSLNNTLNCNSCSGGGGGIVYNFAQPLTFNSVTNTVGLGYNSPGLFIDNLGNLSVKFSGVTTPNYSFPLAYNSLNNTVTLKYNNFIFGLDNTNSLDIG